MNRNMLLVLLKTSALLWLIWGIAHTFFGIMIMNGVISGDIASSIIMIADSVNPSKLRMAYPDALGGILGQHGYNLLWFGIVTTIGGIFIWKINKMAIFLTALVGGLADLGYFIFVDLGGFNLFMPGTLMTLVSLSAIILSFFVYFKSDKLQIFN